MGKFEFRSSSIRLEIAGNIFQVDAGNPGLVERVREFGIEARTYASGLDQEKDISVQLEAAVSFCDRALDEILGAGSSTKIFADRGRNLFDRLDVLSYVIDEFNAFQKEHARQYSPDRVAHRAQKK